MTDSSNGSPPPKPKKPRSRADFDAAVADIEATVRARNAKIEAQVRATNAKIEERTGRNLPAAIAIGIVFGAVLLASLIFFNWIFMILAIALLVLLALELTAAFRQAGHNVPRVASAISAAIVVPSTFFFGSKGQWLGLLVGVLVVTVWRLIEAAIPSRRKSASDVVKDILAGLFIQSYAVFLGSFTVLLVAQKNGQWWVLGFLIVVISTDTGAYVAGLLLGRHKMAPRISPKKTWEGFGGSILAALIASALVGFLLLHIEIWQMAVFAVALALTGTLGDLTESLIKRDLGIKDISNWLPGHGGFLDRLDSILPSAAVAYALFLIFNGAR